MIRKNGSRDINTDFKSIETVQSPLFTSTSSSNSAEEDSQQSNKKVGISELIPLFIRDICRVPNSVELRVSYNAPTVQTTYYYTITWDEKDDKEETYRELLEQQLTDGSVKSPNTLPTPNNSTSLRTYRDLPPVSAICDGPCKKEFPSNFLSTIGRCGHYLCAACYGIVKNSDGTNGCSSAHCNWRGNNRKEAKKYFEKEVCQKQRIRAREMKSREIDVKSASSASSSSKTASLKSGPTTPTTTGTSEETDCSFQVPTTPSVDSSTCSSVSSQESSKPSKFKLVYPSEEELISVKLYILEPTSSKSKKSAQYLTHVTEYEVLSNIKVDKLITALILQKYESLPRKNTGVLYHVELQPNWSRRARQVPASAYTSAALYEFSQIADHIIFLVDFGGFVTDGSVVNVK